MTDMNRLKEGIITATLGLDDMRLAEAGDGVHFLTKSEYKKVDEMIDFLTEMYIRA